MKKSVKERANYMARIIREGRRTSRKFDDCVEWGDGAAVVDILVARADKRGGRLAENLPRYIAEASIARSRAKLTE